MEKLVYRPIVDFHGKVEGLARLRFVDDAFVGIEAYRNGIWKFDAQVNLDLHEGYLGDAITLAEAERLMHELERPEKSP